MKNVFGGVSGIAMVADGACVQVDEGIAVTFPTFLLANKIQHPVRLLPHISDDF